MDGEYSIPFARLFHSLIRHDYSESEKERAEGLVQWISNNLVTLRTCCIDVEADLIGIICKFAFEHQAIPSFDSVREALDRMDKTQEIHGLLEHYCDIRSTLKVHDAGGLDEVLATKVTEYENEKLLMILKTARRVVAGGIPDKKTGRTLAGAKDSLNYLMAQMEKGILLNRSAVVRPLVVQKEADKIGARYDHLLNRGHYESGIEGLKLYPGGFLGVLGYTGGGKSTLCRYICYCLALEGRHVLHVSLENDSDIECDKYVVMHAHNPKWGGEFEGLTYKEFKDTELMPEYREALDVVAADFRDTVQGRITILQPYINSWESVRQMVELHSGRQQVDVLFIDYLQLASPDATRNEDGRTRMTHMVKEVRQFGLSHQTLSGEPLLIINPIQANEDGKRRAEAADGIWELSAINDAKELARSCDRIIGVWSTGEKDVNGMQDCLLSCVKDRDGLYFPPVPFKLSAAGWVHDRPIVFGDTVTMDDIIDPELV